jgi:serine/threonine-protein kinase HipA
MKRKAMVLVSGKRAGEITEGDEGYAFTYDPSYLRQTGPQSVSLTLPLRPEPYLSKHVHPFFSGLLAEGGLAQLQCRMLHIDERDTFGRLLATCRDTIGAVTIEPLT